MTGETVHNLRGDYSRMRPDYTVEQEWDGYSDAEHDLWRRLFARQVALAPKYACDEFVEILPELHFGDGIPRFDEVNAKLKPATNWQLVAVPGLLPDITFFDHLANRRFPVTVWLRDPKEFDYIVEPDIFHDFYGHVPLLFQPVFADYLQAYGRGGLKAHALGAIEMLARLYWYTVEFGLIETPKGLRSYGAGTLSSGGELPYCVDSPNPNRIGFDLLRIMRTRYKIDTFQETYFVIRDFSELFEATAPDFTPYYELLQGRPPHEASTVLPTDRVL
ncbi:phenylalanine 4-monooxygenase [Usitatibacter palustris]|uniref:Phenylalanine-4-hydroxylase n=1 Tax=Usitatibacter palustris TaxID=2732487 RepID=A0A6M4H9A9_9PROT|nr:phenylalanine 4-monooxygenase [Usitatibacter palustris]QJR16161.1 Phenylalanine-4-hydroxylase [Usitatibacter palustris]